MASKARHGSFGMSLKLRAVEFAFKKGKEAAAREFDMDLKRIIVFIQLFRLQIQFFTNNRSPNGALLSVLSAIFIKSEETTCALLAFIKHFCCRVNGGKTWNAIKMMLLKNEFNGNVLMMQTVPYTPPPVYTVTWNRVLGQPVWGPVWTRVNSPGADPTRFNMCRVDSPNPCSAYALCLWIFNSLAVYLAATVASAY